jgi:hypothetical protein
MDLESSPVVPQKTKNKPPKRPSVLEVTLEKCVVSRTMF